jgi:hypothetical protein
MTDLSPNDNLPQTLGHAFETFEAIRQLARHYEDQSPDLFAAFMSAAVAAANGRDAILTADAQPTRPDSTEPSESAPNADPHQIADSIAASAAVLATRLDNAAELAMTPQDRRACHDAGTAARQIHQLLAAADDSHTG